MSEVTARTGARGGGVVLAGSAAVALIQFLALIVLSRLLSPDAFGLLAMASVFLAVGSLIRDFGMPTAALQVPNLSAQQAANLFWMSALLSAVAALAVALSAPLLGALYSDMRLVEMVPVLAGTILISGIGAQFQVQLARRMRFTALAVSDVTAQAAGLGVAIFLALEGAEHWALVAQHLVSACVALVLRWILCGWMPSRYRRGHGSMKMFRSGAEYGIAYVLQFAQTYAASLIIGVRLDAVALGYYNRAQQVLLAPSQQVFAPLTNVVIPTIHRARKEGVEHHVVLLRVQFLLCASITGVFAVSAGVSDALIPWVMGEQWNAVTPIFQILAIGGSIGALNHVSYWGFISSQRSDELLRYNLISKPLALLCILIGSGGGLQGVAWGFVAGVALSWPLNLLWLSRSVGVPAGPFFKQGVSIGLGGLVGWLVTKLLNMVLSRPLGEPTAVLLSGLLGVLALCILWWTLRNTRSAIRQSVLLLRRAISGPGR